MSLRRAFFDGRAAVHPANLTARAHTLTGCLQPSTCGPYAFTSLATAVPYPDLLTGTVAHHGVYGCSCLILAIAGLLEKRLGGAVQGGE